MFFITSCRDAYTDASAVSLRRRSDWKLLEVETDPGVLDTTTLVTLKSNTHFSSHHKFNHHAKYRR